MFYVYEHWRPDRDEPFYVGKGKGGRANLMARRNKHHQAIQEKLHRLGMAVEVRIIASSLTEEEAFNIEKEQIAMWVANGIDLANKTTGGEGVAGLVFSKEHRCKLSEAGKGKIKGPLPEWQKKFISEINKGNQYRLGAVLSPETKAKISASNKGKSKGKGIRKTEEHKKKISATISKLVQGKNNPFFGKHHSEETKRKISETKKLRYANASR